MRCCMQATCTTQHNAEQRNTTDQVSDGPCRINDNAFEVRRHICKRRLHRHRFANARDLRPHVRCQEDFVCAESLVHDITRVHVCKARAHAGDDVARLTTGQGRIKRHCELLHACRCAFQNERKSTNHVIPSHPPPALSLSVAFSSLPPSSLSLSTFKGVVADQGL